MKQNIGPIFCILLSVTIQIVSCDITVYDGEGCNTCLTDSTNYAGVCRSTSSTQSYCCSQDEIDDENDLTCGQSELCSTEFTPTNLAAITCPHKKYRCGISSPEMGLYMNQTLSVEIDVSNNFGPDDSCYYHFYAGDYPEEADPMNLKHLQVYFTNLQGMTAYIGTADAAANLTEETQIDSYYYNFTTPFDQDFWVVLQAEDGSDKGDYLASITFSYYEYDPNCVQYTYWNGEECEPDYDEYCAQYDEVYSEQYNPDNNPNITVEVKYNGTNCVIFYDRIDTDEQIQYVESTDTIFEEIIVEEIIYEEINPKTEPIYIQEEVRKITDGVRVEQNGLTVLSAVTALGVFIFGVQESIRSCQASSKANKVQKIAFGTTQMAESHDTGSRAAISNQHYTQEHGASSRRIDLSPMEHGGRQENESLGGTFDLKNVKSHHDYYPVENAPVSIMDLHPMGIQSNTIDMRGNSKNTRYDQTVMSDYDSQNTDRNSSLHASTDMKKKMNKKTKQIKQDMQIRVKGENQYGSIDDEVFASAHFSQDPQSLTDFDQNYKYNPKKQKRAGHLNDKDYSYGDEYDDENADRGDEDLVKMENEVKKLIGPGKSNSTNNTPAEKTKALGQIPEMSNDRDISPEPGRNSMKGTGQKSKPVMMLKKELQKKVAASPSMSPKKVISPKAESTPKKIISPKSIPNPTPKKIAPRTESPSKPKLLSPKSPLNQVPQKSAKDEKPETKQEAKQEQEKETPGDDKEVEKPGFQLPVDDDGYEDPIKNE